MKKQWTWIDYSLIFLSVLLFGLSVFMLVWDIPYIAVAGFCAYGCSLLALLKRQISRPEPAVQDQPAYKELKRQYESNRRAMDVRMQLLTTKIQEKDRELNRYRSLYGGDDEAADEEQDIEQLEILDIPDRVEPEIGGA